MKTHFVAGLLGFLLFTSLFATLPNQGASAIVRAQQPTNVFHDESGLTLAYHSETGKVRFLSVAQDQALEPTHKLSPNPSVIESARGFASEYASLFGLDDADNLRVLRAERAAGRHYLRFQQTHQGIPILGGELIVQLNARQQLLSMQGELLPDLQLDTQPSLSAEQALQEGMILVTKHYRAEPTQIETSEPELWIYNPSLLGGPGPRLDRLVWRVELRGETSTQPFRELILINAQTGGIELHFNQVMHAKERRICDGQNTITANNDVLWTCDKDSGATRTEDQSNSGIRDVDLAYQYSGDTYDYYHHHFGRDSFDNQGATIISVVNYCTQGQNCPLQGAFWDGKRMVYGAGFGAADDVVGHEITHAFIQHSSGLIYYHQSGAINESLADTFGEFIDLGNGAGNDSAEHRWSLGEDTPPGQKRNMANPPLKGHPDRMGSPLYLHEALEDNGGVHTNSGVGNKAAYLITDGGTFNGQTIRGIGQSKAQQIYYHVAAHMLTSASNYADFGSALNAACYTLIDSYGIVADDCQQVQKAIIATEMLQEPKRNTNNQAFVCPGDLPMRTLFFDDMEYTASGNWRTQALNGVETWYYPSAPNFTTSGKEALWGYAHGGLAGNPRKASNYTIGTTKAISITDNTFVHFQHAYTFETRLGLIGEEDQYYDGGIFEYSIDDGYTWNDIADFTQENGYNGIINGNMKYGGSSNILAYREAFVGSSPGYISSRYDLSPLKGKRALFRFHIAVDNSIGNNGWLIDDFRVYTCDTSSLVNTIYAPLIQR
jgi:bacillolysin